MISMKGVELPISTIIVIILVLIVLIAIVGLFYGVWPGGVQATTLESVKANACQMLMSTGGCSNSGDNGPIWKTAHIYIRSFDADKNGNTNDPGSNTVDPIRCQTGASTNDNLFMLCLCWYNIGGNDDVINKNCKAQVCGCPSSTS